MSAFPLVSVQWLERHLSDADVIPVDGSWYMPGMSRDADAEFLSKHIPGAVRFDLDQVRDTSSDLPHMLPSPLEFAKAVSEMGIGNESRLVVYDGAGLFSAARVRWMFEIFDAKHVFVLDGGFPLWVESGLPIETGAQKPRSRSVFTPRFQSLKVADSRLILEAMQHRNAQIVDARSRDRFAGMAPEPRAGVRPGHIPESFNLPFSELISKHRLKSAAEIEEIFKREGIDLDAPIIATCGSGVTAAILALAVEVTKRARPCVYDGSWAEWGADRDLPIATSD